MERGCEPTICPARPRAAAPAGVRRDFRAWFSRSCVDDFRDRSNLIKDELLLSLLSLSFSVLQTERLHCIKN